MKNSPYNKMGECESQKREGGIFCRNLRKNENSANIKRIEQVCQIQSEFAELTLIIDWGRCHRHRFSFEPYCKKKNPN